jgi:pimeloyl-ACP methyl ester carboxylesterase
VAFAFLALSGCTSGGADVEPAPVPSPSVTATEPAALRPFYQQQVRWTDCGQFQCATVEAPLDYGDPAGRRIELALLKRPANDQGKRIGTLFVNPGGPGVSGLSFAKMSGALFTTPILDSFDIVGWDPRGVGESTAISCLSDTQTDTLLEADGTPDNAAEVKRLVRLNQQFTKGCEADDAVLLPQLGTLSSARDMDLLRAAVGDQRLNYFGASYGTELGSVYADLFPERVGRMVLDGALDPALTSAEISIGQLEGFQGATDAFIQDCLARDGCPIGPTPEAAQAQIEQLLADADTDPLRTQSGRPLTEALATLGMISAMYSESAGWPALRLGLAQAFDGDGTVLLALADSYSERQPDGTYRSNVNSAFPAISCTDRPGSLTPAQIEESIPRYQRISPIFGETFAWGGLSCRDWPVARGELPERVTAKGADPIVVIGTTRDPATPFAWSKSLADSLRNGVLIARDGDGHTGYNAGNECVNTAVEQFLVAGRTPDDPTRC